MPATADNSSRGDQTRTRLLEVAVDTFGRKGFHGTTTRDIASAAGMSPAAVYVHHKSKEELLYVLSRSGHQATVDLIDAALTSAGDPPSKLHAVFRAFAVHHAREHASARVVNYELDALTPEHLADIRGIRRKIDAQIRQLLDEGIATGDFDIPNVGMTQVALLSLGIDIARWYRDEGSWSPEEIGEFYGNLAQRVVSRRGTAS